MKFLRGRREEPGNEARLRTYAYADRVDRSGTLWSGLRLWIMDRTCIGIIVLYHCAYSLSLTAPEYEYQSSLRYLSQSIAEHLALFGAL